MEGSSVFKGINLCPPSLYRCCCVVVAKYYRQCQSDIRTLPKNITFDILSEVYNLKAYSTLADEISDVQQFYKLLLNSHRKSKLLKCFQSLVENYSDIESRCVQNYVSLCINPSDIDTVIDIGICLGDFLSEGGWYESSINILKECFNLIHPSDSENKLPRIEYSLECSQKLLHSFAGFHKFKEAENIFDFVLDLSSIKESLIKPKCLSSLFSEFSVYFFRQYNYMDAYFWSTQALKTLSESTPIPIVIDVLRQAARTCTAERKLKQAELLINQAINLGEKYYEPNSLKLADILSDYGFYLLHSDSIHQSVCAYEAALEILLDVFGENNLRVAILEEDLAYSLYVQEYSTGRFQKATLYADKALNTVQRILPNNHMIFGSAQRMKALILEEIALDLPSARQRKKLGILMRAEQLHKSALRSAVIALGDSNVLMAKHYGNLGRLYQSMQNYKLSKAMHLKSIEIKERLLGPDHFEVGLSVGHLASLYNYHLKNYAEAEQLYLRSLAINSKLFGDSYSGLEYDYKGLIHLYESSMNVEKTFEYTEILFRWKQLRENIKEDNSRVKKPLLSIEEIKSQFFELHDKKS